MKLCRRNKAAIMRSLKIDEKMFQLFLELIKLDEDFITDQVDKIEEETGFKKKFYGSADTTDSATELALHIMDYYLDNHGVEGVDGKSAWNGSFWRDSILSYSNTGDTYDATVVYDVAAEEFMVTSYGDWVEANMDLEEVT